MHRQNDPVTIIITRVTLAKAPKFQKHQALASNPDTHVACMKNR